MDVKNIEALFSETDVRYRIPIYQRHYVWENNNWRHLWDDLQEKADCSLMGEDVKSHFTGVIVIRGENETREIVDGQQRLTTFQIILCAIRDLSKEADYNNIAKFIEEQLLKNDSDSDLDPSVNYKLLPTAKSDKQAFELLVAGDAAKSSGRIHDAYVYFRKKIKAYIAETKDENEAESKMLNLRNVFLDSFHVVELPLNPTDEAAKIFEALNGRGRALSQFDHLRNNVFLRAGDDRSRLYKKYWKHFNNEENWDSDEVVDPFLENFLKAKLAQNFDSQLPHFDLYQRVYRKELREKLNLDEDSVELVEREFKELKRHSDVYADIINCDYNNPLWFYQLLETEFKTTGWLPLILFLKSEKEELELSDDDLELILRSLESYIVRCMLYGPKPNPTETRNGIISLIKRQDSFNATTIVNYLQNRWPTDEKIRPVLCKVGNKKRKFTKYILFQIERMITDFSRSEGVLKFDELNIEHVMPQKWKKTWDLPNAEESSPEARAQNAERARDRDQCLQSIGNLTLLTKKLNFELQNKAFPEKKLLISEYSRLKITRKISDAKTEVWDVSQIREREENLSSLFCEIWPSVEGILKPQWRSMITRDNPKLAVSDDLSVPPPQWHSMIMEKPHILITHTGARELSTTEEDKNKVARMLNSKQAVLAYSQKTKNQQSSIKEIPTLENVQKTTISNKLLKSYQQSVFRVKVVTRYKHLLEGTITSFDTDAIYMEINKQTVVVYRNNVHAITKK